MREFDALVFMGAGERSMADSYRLHKILDRALGNLSALQQGVDMDGEWLSVVGYDIEEAVRDISTALLGRQVTMGKALPYPGKIKRDY